MALHPTKTALIGPNSTAFLDLLRALAANLVLYGHWTAVFGIDSDIPTGPLGVSVFFILSGFLILQSSLARLRRPGPHFAPYLIDRFARIFTAYVPVLIMVAAINAVVDLGHWGQDGSSTGVTAFVGNLLLLQDYPVFQVVYRLFGNQLYIRPYNTAEPFWTISIEFWIYVVFGLAFFGLVARERMRRPVAVLLGLIALPVAIWNAAAGGGNGLTLVWLVGAVAAYVWAGEWHRSPHRLRIGAVVGLGAAICLVGRGIKTDWNFQDLSMVICEAAMIVAGVSIMEGLSVLPRALRAFCGFIASYSYSLYLVHNLVLVLVWKFLSATLGWATLPFALAAAHVVGFAVYYLFERHYRQVGQVLKRWLVRPATTARAIPVPASPETISHQA